MSEQHATPVPHLTAADAERGIVTESWSPIGRANTVLTDPAVYEEL